MSNFLNMLMLLELQVLHLQLCQSGCPFDSEVQILSVHEQECKSDPLIPSARPAMLIKASQCCIQIHWQSGNMRLHKH